MSRFFGKEKPEKSLNKRLSDALIPVLRNALTVAAPTAIAHLVPPGTSAANSFDVTLDLCITTCNSIKEIGDMMPELDATPIKATFGVLILVLETVKRCADNRERWRLLAELIVEKNKRVIPLLQLYAKAPKLYLNALDQAIQYQRALNFIAVDMKEETEEPEEATQGLESYWSGMKTMGREATLSNISLSRIRSYHGQLYTVTLNLVEEILPRQEEVAVEADSQDFSSRWVFSATPQSQNPVQSTFTFTAIEVSELAALERAREVDTQAAEVAIRRGEEQTLGNFDLFINVLDELKDESEILGPMRVVYSALLAVTKTVQEVCRNHEDLRGLKETLEEQSDALSRQTALFGTCRSAGNNGLYQVMLNMLVGYARELRRLNGRVDLLNAKYVQGEILGPRLEMMITQAEIMLCMQILNGAFERYKTSITEFITLQIQNVNWGYKRAAEQPEELRLFQLPYSEAQGNQHQSCLDGTRVEAIERLQQWATDPSSSPVMALIDQAGTGKSTLALEMVKRWEISGRLATRFFFSRPSNVIYGEDVPGTLARDLAACLPSTMSFVVSAVGNHINIADYSIERQLQLLIVGPLERYHDQENASHTAALEAIREEFEKRIFTQDPRVAPTTAWEPLEMSLEDKFAIVKAKWAWRDAVEAEGIGSLERLAEGAQNVYLKELEAIHLKVMARKPIIVIDALDECKTSDQPRKNHQSLILSTFLSYISQRSVSSLPFKLLLTGRPTEQITRSLGAYNGCVQRHTLSDLSPSPEQTDIKLFVETMLGKKAPDGPWLDEEQINQFVDRADGLFIWATIAAAVLKKADDKQDRFRLLMHPSNDQAPLDGLYHQILQIVEIKEEHSVLNRLLGVICVAQKPLTVDALDKLLQLQTGVAARIVESLHGVLLKGSKGKPVQVLHPTFIEFLVREGSSHSFEGQAVSVVHSKANSKEDGNIWREELPKPTDPSIILDVAKRCSVFSGCRVEMLSGTVVRAQRKLFDVTDELPHFMRYAELYSSHKTFSNTRKRQDPPYAQLERSGDAIKTWPPFGYTMGGETSSSASPITAQWRATEEVATLEFKFNPTTAYDYLHGDFREAVSTALRHPSDKRTALADVFHEWGHIFPTRVLFGGKHQVSTSDDISGDISDDAIGNYLGDALLNSRSEGVRDEPVWAKNIKVEHEFVGGEPSFRDAKWVTSWKESLCFPLNWDFISIKDTVHIVDLLPESERIEINNLAPKPFTGRWITSDRIEAIRCSNFTAYQPRLTKFELDEGWFSLGQTLNPFIALILKENHALSQLSRPISPIIRIYRSNHDPTEHSIGDRSNIPGQKDNEDSSGTSEEFEDQHSDEFYIYLSDVGHFANLGGFFYKYEGLEGAKSAEEQSHDFRALHKSLLCPVECTSEPILIDADHEEKVSVWAIELSNSERALDLGMFQPIQGIDRPSGTIWALNTDVIDILNPERSLSMGAGGAYPVPLAEEYASAPPNDEGSKRGQNDRLYNAEGIFTLDTINSDLKALMSQRPPADLTGRVSIPDTFNAAHGGFATVYKGYMGKVEVAVKVLKVSYTLDLDLDQENSMRRRLEREIRVWAALSHPNVIDFIGYSNDFGNHTAMISMWCPCGNAAMYLRSNKDITRSERYNLLMGVANGLGYLHDLKVIHGNLKPANVLVDAQGVARLCDFGLVRLLYWEETAGTTTTSPYPGSTRYKAPEMFPSEDNQYPIATFEGDIYAIGCIALEFITSNVPYHGERDYALLQEIQRGNAPAKRPEDARAGEGFEGLFWDMLEGCWSPYPENRPIIEEVRKGLHHLSTLL